MNFFMFNQRKRRNKRIRQRGWFFGLRKLGHSRKRKLRTLVYCLLFQPYYMWVRLFRLIWWSWPGKKTVNVITWVLWQIYFTIWYIIHLLGFWKSIVYRFLAVFIYLHEIVQGERLGISNRCFLYKVIFAFLVLVFMLRRRLAFRIFVLPERMWYRYTVFVKWNEEFRVTRNIKSYYQRICYFVRYFSEDLKIEREYYKNLIWVLFVLKSIFYGYVVYWLVCWYLALLVLEFLS